MDRALKVSDIAAQLRKRFPEERSEAWDRVGLLAGDPDAVVTGVTLSLDPTLESLQSALDAGDNVLVTHHPAFLTPPSTLLPGPGASGVVFAAIDTGVALLNAHTNLDRDPAAQRILPDLLGLKPLHALERDLHPMSVVTVYVPESARDAVAEAMEGAGAGRIGDYTGCSYTSEGTGRFTPPKESSPYSGSPGVPSSAAEDRLEMVCPRESAPAVVAAAVSAHPYEEPLVTVAEILMSSKAARLGMVSEVAAPLTLGLLAEKAADAFSVSPRVWGDPETPVRRIATTTGSGGSLLGDALAAGVDTFVAGEVRYHDALNALEAGCAIVELGHDASEWPLVGLLEECVRSIEGMTNEMVHAISPTIGWWTSHRTQGVR